MNTRKEQLEMLEDCKASGVKLSYYESQFVESISQYMNRAGFLSIRQDSMLGAIWNRVNKSGIK